MPTQSLKKTKDRRLLLILLLIAVVLGALEGLYGRVRYSGDAISYLNVARAIHAGDWKLAFNPMWGIGYPLLVSGVSLLFPQTATGEWMAIHCLNLFIFAAALASFYFLVRVAVRTPRLRWILQDSAAYRFLIVGAFTIFLSIELSMDNVSRVGPDMLVSCLMFLAAALLIKLEEKPELRLAVLLGLITGLGCSVKNVFLPLTFLFAGAVFLTQKDRRAGLLTAVTTLVSAAIFITPYVSGLSWAAGHLTLGESGSINYAWHVNKLEDGAFWQGGNNDPFGKPIHPPLMALDKPHIYLFEEPFPVTFPPFFNPPYFYQGYRHIFHLKWQISAIVHNLYQILKAFKTQVILFALVLCWVLRIYSVPGRGKWLGPRVGLWPLAVISTAGILLYVLVWVEGRYITSFLAMLLLIALFKLIAQGQAGPGLPSAMPNRSLLLWILMIGCASTLIATEHDDVRDVLGHLRHHQFFKNDTEWTAGLYLQQLGLVPGDRVAIVSDLLDSSTANWAYMDHLILIGQLRGEKPPYPVNDIDVFWNSSPQQQKEAMEIFHRAGAKLVFAMAKPKGVDAPGWDPVPGTPFWIYRF